MSVDRNQFKGSTLNSMREEQSRAEAVLPTNNNFGNRPGFHKVEEGENWRRVAPSHSPNDPAYRAVSTVTLECEVSEVDDDGKKPAKK